MGLGSILRCERDAHQRHAQYTCCTVGLVSWSVAIREGRSNHAHSPVALALAPQSGTRWALLMTTPTRTQSPFGILLRRYRERAGLSQDELAERSGLTGQAIGMLERGDRLHPYPATVRQLADALELSEQNRTALLAAVPPRGETAAVSEEVRGTDELPNLPTSLTSLLGREDDAARVIAMLMIGTRLLTLTGPGGVGKSRLAVHVAREMQPSFPDGVVFVPLAPLADAQLVLPAIARTLRVRETGELSVDQLLRSALHAKHLLLVLDNCEHILPAGSEIVELLEACPHLAILATTRAPFRVRGEQEYALAPLALPTFDDATTIDEAAASPAVQLFVERARAIRTGFELTQTNVSAVAAICRRLDGLPLALELAAPRLKLLSPSALLERLHLVLPLLAGGQDVPARQQTLRATFIWSYDLLDAQERALLRHLSVFAGGFTLEAAQATSNGSVGGEVDVLEGLTSLVDKSLLQMQEVAGQLRFGMLETIRDYAQGELRIHGEESVAREAHAAFMVELVQEIEPRLFGPEQVEWMARLVSEQDNVRAALHWLLRSGRLETVGRLLSHLVRFWWISGQMMEAMRWADEVLVRGTEVPASARVQACFVAGTAAAERGDEAAADLFTEARGLAQAEGDRQLEALSLHMEGFVAPLYGDGARGIDLMRQAEKILREIGDEWSLGFCLSGLSSLSALLARLEDAEHFGTQYLAVAQRMGDLLSVARAKDCLALVALLREDFDVAAIMLRESIAIARDVDQPQLIARGLMGLAVVGSRTDPQRAAHYFGAADALREAAGVAIWQVRRPLYDRALMRVRMALDPEALDCAWREGRSMSREQAVAYVLETDIKSRDGARHRNSRTKSPPAREAYR